MLDEIINYVQSLQRQVEVNQHLGVIVFANSSFFAHWVCMFCCFAVPLHEIGFCQYQAGFQLGKSNP